MKKLFLIPLLALSLHAQNVLVRFHADNQPFAGLTNYPAQTQPVTWATNSPGWATNMTLAAYAAHRAALEPIYRAAESNAQATAKAALDANVARLKQLYDGIPDARTTLRNFANGTNTLTNPQRDAALRQSADYTEKLMEFIQRLGPVLKAQYRPEEDTTQ